MVLVTDITLKICEAAYEIQIIQLSNVLIPSSMGGEAIFFLMVSMWTKESLQLHWDIHVDTTP